MLQLALESNMSEDIKAVLKDWLDNKDSGRRN